MSQDLIRRTNTDNETQISRLKSLVLDSVTSAHTKRSYGLSIDEFLLWHQTTYSESGFTRAAVNAYKVHLLTQGLAPSSINVRLSAIRKLAVEAGGNQLMDRDHAEGIKSVKGVKTSGVRLGHWLTDRQAEDLINSPDLSTLKGKRDRAVLALMIGSGLRREEVVSLCMSHVQQREARWVLVDVCGKGLKTRSVPFPSFAKAAIDVWTEAAGIIEGRLFRPVNKGGRIFGERVTAQAIFSIVVLYSRKIGLNMSPHDLRRSFAKMAHRGKAEIDQISLSLGHESIKTTQIYLGIEQSLVDAPCDHLNLKL